MESCNKECRYEDWCKFALTECDLNVSRLYKGHALKEASLAHKVKELLGKIPEDGLPVTSGVLRRVALNPAAESWRISQLRDGENGGAGAPHLSHQYKIPP